jgi:hypothetical protein
MYYKIFYKLLPVVKKGRQHMSSMKYSHLSFLFQVARGNCLLSINGGNVRCVLQAMKKFTGGLGDDDDRKQGDNSTWKRYFVKVYEFKVNFHNVQRNTKFTLNSGGKYEKLVTSVI